MNESYPDIRALTDAEPTWFDEHAVPRYCAFEPQRAANIYADEVALVLIGCQNCGHPFKVCLSLSTFDRLSLAHESGRDPVSLTEQAAAGMLHYGDPPNIDCCAAGPSMNCIDLQVLEFWVRQDGRWEWERRPELEVLQSEHPAFVLPN